LFVDIKDILEEAFSRLYVAQIYREIGQDLLFEAEVSKTTQIAETINNERILIEISNLQAK